MANLSVQHEFGSGVVGEAGYLGNESRHLTANDFSLNQVLPQLIGPGDSQVRRPLPQSAT